MKRTKKLRCKGETCRRDTAWLLTMVMFASLFTGIPARQAKAETLSNPRKDENGVVTYDCVYFGNYWQEDTNGDGKADKSDAKTPIKWRVLSVEGDDVFLIADKNLDMQMYNNKSDVSAMYWETSTIRSWLNGYGSDSNSDGTDYSGEGASFISNAFTESERNAIKSVTLENKDNQFYGTKGGPHPIIYISEEEDSKEDTSEEEGPKEDISEEESPEKDTSEEERAKADVPKVDPKMDNDTTDKVFLLSLEDIANPLYGFSGFDLTDGNSEFDYAKRRFNTDFAKGSDTASGYSKTSKIGTGWWWLRSPGLNTSDSVYVNDKGGVDQYGTSVYANCFAVCPALHLSLSSGCWSHAKPVNNDEWKDPITEEPTTETSEELTTATTEEPTPEEKPDYGLKNPKKGIDGKMTYSCIYFGNYWQEDTNADGKADKKDDKTPIKWRVLSVEKEEGRALLIADKILDMQKYNDSSDSVTWETCTIRSWLNGYGSGSNKGGSEKEGIDYSGEGASFISNAFTEGERKAIESVTLENKDNQFYGTKGCSDTTDKVFLLSLEDIAKTSYGFSNFSLTKGNGNPVDKILYGKNNDEYKIYDEAKLRYNTEFAKGSDTASGYKWTSAIGTSWWWLRSPGDERIIADKERSNVADVHSNGYVDQTGYYVNGGSHGVCPALYLDISRTDLWTPGENVDSSESDSGLNSILGRKKSVVKAAKVEITGISKKIAAGKKFTLTPVFTPSNCSNKKLKWKSSNTKYATVSDKGVVITKKQGVGKTVTITAMTQDGSNIEATYKIKLVKDAVKSVKLKAKSKSVKAGNKLLVKADIKTTGKAANKTLQWSSSNRSYATVTKNGVVKTKKAGKGKKVKITAKATDGSGKKATIKIKIK